MLRAELGKEIVIKVLNDAGILADIAPTMLELLGIPKPKEMTAESLLARQAYAKHSDAKHLKGR